MCVGPNAALPLAGGPCALCRRAGPPRHARAPTFSLILSGSLSVPSSSLATSSSTSASSSKILGGQGGQGLQRQRAGGGAAGCMPCAAPPVRAAAPPIGTQPPDPVRLAPPGSRAAGRLGAGGGAAHTNAVPGEQRGQARPCLHRAARHPLAVHAGPGSVVCASTRGKRSHARAVRRDANTGPCGPQLLCRASQGGAAAASLQRRLVLAPGQRVHRGSGVAAPLEPLAKDLSHLMLARAQLAHTARFRAFANHARHPPRVPPNAPFLASCGCRSRPGAAAAAACLAKAVACRLASKLSKLGPERLRGAPPAR